MTSARRMLMETLAGHIALLESKDPRKAASRTARRAKRVVDQSLRLCCSQKRLAA